LVVALPTEDEVVVVDDDEDAPLPSPMPYVIDALKQSSTSFLEFGGTSRAAAGDVECCCA
jgi:hypothetical protein